MTTSSRIADIEADIFKLLDLKDPYLPHLKPQITDQVLRYLT